MRKSKTPFVQVHKGKLYWASLFNLFPIDLFVPKKKTADDPFSLGWQLGNPKRELLIQFEGMNYATAEAAVALAAVVEKLNSLAGAKFFQAEFGETSHEWFRGLRLDQVARHLWQMPERAWARPFDCYAYPVRRIKLDSPTDAASRATGLAKAIRLLPEEIFGNDREEVLASVEYVAYEAFLNIFEHAYRPDESRYLYASATVTPARHFEDSKDLAVQFTSPQELAWLKANRDNLILEIAVADTGRGIPQSLWADAVEKQRLFAKEWTHDSFRPEFRASAHQHLCEYAFHHDSTCRREPAALSAGRLSFRGLHRCLKQAEYLSGCVLLASGQGRAGYVFVNGRMMSISPPRHTHCDFPGTLVVLRFPAFRKTIKPTSAPHGGNPIQVRVGFLATPMELKTGMPHEDVGRAFAASDKEIGEAAKFDLSDEALVMKGLPSKQVVDSLMRFSNVGPKVVVAFFPFCKFRRERELMKLLPALTPNHVALLLFGHIPGPVRTQLRAYTADWSPMVHGTPRLLCLWDPERWGFEWQIAGESPVPRKGQKLYSDLEHQGHANLAEEDDTVHTFAKELARTYRDFLIWDEPTKTLSFTGVESILAPEDYGVILNEAFRAYFENESTDGFLFKCKNGEAIRLPTGRLVKKFLSVLNLLRSVPVLSAALSQRLFHLLENIGKPSNLCLVADTPASYFVANLLLRDKPGAPQVTILGQGTKAPSSSRSVLFVDAIFRGETINRISHDLSSQSGWCKSVIACVDMRRAPLSFIEKNDWQVESLLKFYFDPCEWTDPTSPTQVYEVDAITHVPFSHVRLCEFAKLGVTPGAEQFLQQHPEVFLSGFHQLGAQVHTVSLRTQELIRESVEFVVESITDQIVHFLREFKIKIPSCSVVLFCRPQSHIFSVIQKIAEELPRKITSLKSVFISNLIVAPLTPKPVFPRAEENILADVRDAISHLPLFPEKPQPIQDFAGIYLDDGSITGKSLQDFLAKATSLRDSKPKALLALLVVNRLSPREVRFFNICRELSSTSPSNNVRRKTATIPFRLASLFRLQVKAVNRSELNSTPHLVTQIHEHADYFDERLKQYAAAILDRINSIFGRSDDGAQSDVIILHPWYPRDSEISSPTLRAVRLRHLLSLNEQNEGVMSEILAEVTEAVAKNDFSVVSMLALEPHLLTDDPLPNQCWPQLHSLCWKCLQDSTAIALKSDAIAVLCHRPEEFVRELSSVLKLAAYEADLVNQIAAFLLTFSRRDRAWNEIVQKGLDALWKDVPQETIDWLRTVMDVPQRVEASYVVKDEAEAVARIHTLIATTWTHVGLQDWQAFDASIKEVSLGGKVLTDDEITLGNRCADYAERCLLSGLAGLRYLASKRLKPEQVKRSWDALIEGIRKAMAIRSLLGQFADSDGEWRSNIVVTWNHLRKLTLKAASPVRILGNVEEISSEPSVIEQLLPKLFGAPYPLIQKLAQKILPNLQIQADSSVFLEGTVVVPVPRDLLNDFLRIMVGNMAKYGEPTDCSCLLSLAVSDSKHELTIEFFDRKRSGSDAGEGTGILLMEEYARQGGFIFGHQLGKEEFRATVRFPEALTISPQISKT